MDAYHGRKRKPGSGRSGKQHGKSRALAVVVPADPQFATDLPCEGLNDPHPQPLAGVGVEPFRQRRAVIGNRQRVAMLRIRLQPDGDPALAYLAAFVIISLAMKPSGIAVAGGRTPSRQNRGQTPEGTS